MAPVVHDKARALDKGTITVRNAAHEVCHHPVLLLVVHSQLRVRAGRHSLKAGVVLALHDLAPTLEQKLVVRAFTVHLLLNFESILVLLIRLYDRCRLEKWILLVLQRFLVVWSEVEEATQVTAISLTGLIGNRGSCFST